MSKPIIHFPMDEDELLDLVEILKSEVTSLKYEEGNIADWRRGRLLLLQIRLSATYKELTGLSGNQN